MNNNFFNYSIFIFLFFFIPALGQDINTLDEKNGFKNLKLNSDKLNYVNNLELIESTNEISTYDYLKNDSSLFDLFGNKINSIHLTFDNNTNKLKKISLDIGKEYSVNYLTQLGWYLKKLYYNFEEIIGPTTQIKKPSNDCQNPNTICLFFEDLVFDGKIIWEAKNINLEIIHKTKYDVKNNGGVSLMVYNQVVFIDKDFDLKEKNSKF
jgi:hypothetical protein